MTTNQLAQFVEAVEWSRRPDSIRATMVPPVLDPRLLHDLADALEFIHGQLDDSESELQRSREQSSYFEQDARRWEQEAARLRQEASDTRRVLDQLRKDFDELRDSSQRQNLAFERIVEEMTELRAARAQVEDLASEQQRALALSLELLKRVNSDEPVATDSEEPPRGHQEVAARLQEKDDEIGRLKCLIETADRATVAAQTDLAALRSELQSARAQVKSTATQVDSWRTELAGSRTECESVNAQLKLARDELKRLTVPDPSPQVEPHPDQAAQIQALADENVRIAQNLKDTEAEVALQNAEVDSRGAIIIALENALEEQNTSLRALEDRFLAYAEQVQSLQLEHLRLPVNSARGIASRFAKLFSPPKQKGRMGGSH